MIVEEVHEGNSVGAPFSKLGRSHLEVLRGLILLLVFFL